ncbi:ADP-ribosylation factor-like protein 9 isoform X3 [Catharus ustulatus]|uniref:ADP-ribosylation factor-like protein 9 isoform X3 n=1 Tax=Catharus ustulatus TaxID=91951 RepID=UPI00140C9A38|nr:ADP-ribosylation factor-like protein 9 isoform X3 [Catharus ustulatus]
MVVALRAWARLRSRVALPARSVAAAADQGKGHSKQILVLGLDGAGKTSILHSLAINHVKRSVAPTEGFNAICIYTEESQMDFLEIGGSESLRSYWKMYLPKVLLLVYVVDSADHARLPMAKQLLHQLIQNNSTLPVVVLANKQDLKVPSYTSYTPVSPRSRIHVLAEPKPVFCESSPRCRPVIGGRALLAKFGYPSERLLRLAEPKKYLPAYLEKRARESPEWPVSLAARNYNASQRILELAQPKGLHPDFMPAREVSRSPQKAIASPRTIELSKPKQLHANYTPPRDPEWPVTEAAKRAVATPRVLELAQPSTRPRMGLATLNPDAFRVKGTAMKAACSPRLQELARPIQR